MRSLAIALVALLAACSSPSGSGTAATANSRLGDARLRLASALSRLSAGEKTEGLCDVELCGDSTVACENLRRLSRDETLLQAARETAGDPASARALATTLARVTYTENTGTPPADSTHDAYTSGEAITFFAERLRDRSADGLFAVWAHELGHAAGARNSSQEERALDERAACLVAYVNGIENRPRRSADRDAATLFSDGFTAPLATLADRYRGNIPALTLVDGALSTIAGVYPDAIVRGISRRDVRVRVEVDLTQPTLSWVHVRVRSRGNDTLAHLATISYQNNADGTRLQIKLWRVTPDPRGDPVYTTLETFVDEASPDFASRRGELVFQAVGNRFDVSYRGSTYPYIDPTLPADGGALSSGEAGLRLGGAMRIRHLSVEIP